MFDFFAPPITTPVQTPVVAKQPIVIAQNAYIPETAREAFILRMADQMKRSWCYGPDVQAAVVQQILNQIHANGYGEEAQHMMQSIHQFAMFVSTVTCE